MEWDPAAAWTEVAREVGLPLDAPSLQLSPQPVQHADWPGWVAPRIRQTLEATGIIEPYRHQVVAADHAWQGRDVALATGTATGKSLAYLLPILGAIGDDEAMPSTALYLAPTKALAHDQLRRLAPIDLPGLRCAPYDGDTPPEERRWARRHATLVVSNPDMLHAGILPNHAAWQSFLKRLRFVIIDEFHVYRGLFGAHLAAVLRRLLRVAEHYGGAPTVIGTSATVADPAGTLATLTGRPAAAVDRGAALTRAQTELVLVPSDGTGLIARTAGLLAALVARDIRTLAFVRSRRGAEVVAAIARERLEPHGLAERVAPYRSGYLPEERRALERDLRDGATQGMAATSALELGIDVSGLDAVVVAGWPGTRAALRQRLGRAGRSGRPALAVFLADDNPLDAHLVRHPDHLVEGLEGLVIDAANPYVLGPHLCAAAAELPLTDEETTQVFGPEATDLLPVLGERGLLRRRPSGWFWTRPDRAADLADLRGATGDPVAVVESGTGRLIGTVDRGSADRSVHAGAVYAHRGEHYLIAELDLAEGVARAARTDVPYGTHAQTVHDIRLLQTLRSTQWGPVGLHYGVVEVTAQVTSFVKRRISTGSVIGREPLSLPQRTLRTKAVWWTIPDPVLGEAGIAPAALAGAAHAAEHAAISMLPLFAHCDRWDIGGVSTPQHPDTGTCTIVVHDGLPGGAGFAERGFAAAVEWWSATLHTVAACSCADGCPGCVQSPKCGNGNEPLDKGAAVALLRAVAEHGSGG